MCSSDLADAGFGRLRAHLEARGEWDDALVVVTSDHGHELWERDRHGHQRVYQEQLHVPLIVKLPGEHEPARRSDYIGLVDLMPTLLAACDIDVPKRAEGRVLDFATPSDAAAPPSYASANWPEHIASFRSGRLKAIVPLEPPGPVEVYDLGDGREDFDLGPDRGQKAFVERARATIDAWRAGWIDKGVELGLRQRDALGERLADLDPAMRNELSELGYLDDDE